MLKHSVELSGIAESGNNSCGLVLQSTHFTYPYSFHCLYNIDLSDFNENTNTCLYKESTTGVSQRDQSMGKRVKFVLGKYK